MVLSSLREGLRGKVIERLNIIQVEYRKGSGVECFLIYARPRADRDPPAERNRGGGFFALPCYLVEVLVLLLLLLLRFQV